jgi:hypothetical protein
MVKLVRTPAILTKAADCLGYPVFSNAQISVVVLYHVSATSMTRSDGFSPSNVHNQNFPLIRTVLRL